MYNKTIINIKPMGFMWETIDPFLFCVHHLDQYPRGNEQLGPDASLKGRPLGQDFNLKDGWRMYHGTRIPGFPAHPHRGFETVTIVLQGFVDHSDSHGAAGRYGMGDVQWMTAGSGLQHCEMFPLMNPDKENPLELFQIWLNLPKERKFAEPHFKMLWAEDIPIVEKTDDAGKSISLRVIAGNLEGAVAPPPAPDSWAAVAENETGIFLIKMQAGARWVLPAISEGANRTLYFYKGSGFTVAGVETSVYNSVQLNPAEDVMLSCNDEDAYLLVLQAMPIAEPVAKYGPFVMNTQAEIQQAISDYRQTEFGGWPWPTHDHVHANKAGRFATYASGKTELPG